MLKRAAELRLGDRSSRETDIRKNSLSGDRSEDTIPKSMAKPQQQEDALRRETEPDTVAVDCLADRHLRVGPRLDDTSLVKEP